MYRLNLKLYSISRKLLIFRKEKLFNVTKGNKEERNKGYVFWKVSEAEDC